MSPEEKRILLETGRYVSGRPGGSVAGSGTRYRPKVSQRTFCLVVSAIPRGAITGRYRL
jgi:hypothetical protein